MGTKHKGWSVSWRSDRGFWRCTMYVAGQKIQRKITGLKKSDKAEAQRRGAVMYADQTRGLATEEIAPATLTVRHMLEHEVSKPGITDETRRWKKTKARRLLEVFSALPVRDLNRQRLDAYQERRLAAGVTAKTVNYELGLLRTSLRTAIEDGALKSMPVVFKRLPQEHAEPKALSKDAAERFLAAVEEVDRKKPPRGRMPTLSQVVVFALNTGLRRSEIFRLRWDEVDLDAGTALIRRRKRGTAAEYQEKEIPLNSDAILALRARQLDSRGSDDPRVFGYRADRPGSEPCSRAIYDRLKDAARLAGLEESPALHKLRHTFATLLHRQKVDPVTIKNLLGHRDISTTLNMYVHTSKDQQVEAVRGLGLRRRQ